MVSAAVHYALCTVPCGRGLHQQCTEAKASQSVSCLLALADSKAKGETLLIRLVYFVVAKNHVGMVLRQLFTNILSI